MRDVKYMPNEFQVASGSIIGRDHVLARKNNQDAFHCVDDGKFLVAVVCDGCGSGKYTEVGAQLFSKATIRTLLSLLHSPLNGMNSERFHQDALWICLANIIGSEIRDLVMSITGSRFPYSTATAKEVIENYALFTIVGAVIGETFSACFKFGDGSIVINGELDTSFQCHYANNSPPYIAYAAIAENYVPFDRKFLATSEINSLVIATDGIDDLTTHLKGDLSEFWENDKYYKNPDMLRRRLAVINTEHQKINWKERTITKTVPPLRDDTTMIVIRRKPGGG